jgi:hypothetical protein
LTLNKIIYIHSPGKEAPLIWCLHLLLLPLVVLLLPTGDVSAALSSAARVLTGQVKAGAQRHFYMVRADGVL